MRCVVQGWSLDDLGGFWSGNDQRIKQWIVSLSVDDFSMTQQKMTWKHVGVHSVAVLHWMLSRYSDHEGVHS